LVAAKSDLQKGRKLLLKATKFSFRDTSQHKNFYPFAQELRNGYSRPEGFD